MSSALLPLPGGSQAAKRRKGSTALLVMRTPLHSAGAMAAVLIVVGIVFPAQTPLPCGGAGGGWGDLTSLDPDDPKAVDRSHKKTVHLTGQLQAVSLNDDEFQFMREGVVLHRLVEMFQWDRDASAKDGYSRRWSTDVIDSKGFPQGKLNPLVLPFSNHTQVSLPARLQGNGMLRIDQALVPMLSFFKREPVVHEDIARLPSELHGTLRVADGYFFRGRDMQYPSVGDIRVSFYLVRAGDVSLVGRLRGRNLETCTIERGGVGRMSRPRGNSRRGGKTAGSGLGIGRGGGGGGGQARNRKRKVGRRFMDKLGSVADALRGTLTDEPDLDSGSGPKLPQLEEDEDTLLPLAAGAFILPGLRSPFEMERVLRGRLERRGAESRGLWVGVIAPSWTALLGWIVAGVVVVLHYGRILEPKAAKYL